MAAPCAACESAIYGPTGAPINPCKASYQLYHEISNVVDVNDEQKENVKALEDFVSYPVTHEMIAYIAKKASEVIPCADVDTAAFKKNSSIPSLERFITSVVERSHCQVATLMTSLVFLHRLKERLPNIAQGLPCTRHRLFLASLILSAKYVNDSSPKNKHWSIYSHLKEYPKFGFNLLEVNLMEKQMLFLLDWDLVIVQSDLLTHFEPFLKHVRSDRASIRLENELYRRELAFDEDIRLPVPIHAIPPPPKGTKPPTARERKRAHAAGVLYPDEERHQFLVSKCEPESLPSDWPTVPIQPEPLIMEIDEADPYLLSKFSEKLYQPEENDCSDIYYHTANGPTKESVEVPGLFSIGRDFDDFSPTEMSRSSTQDSYLSNSSSRFNSLSRDLTPGSSISGDDLDYDCHDDEDQHDIFLSGLDSPIHSINASPEQLAYFPKSQKLAHTIYHNLGGASAARPRTTRSNASPHKGAGSPVRNTSAPSQRVSPTQGHTGIGKKAAKAGESKSMLRIRQTLQVLEAEGGDGLKSNKRSRFLPKFLGGGSN